MSSLQATLIVEQNLPDKKVIVLTTHTQDKSVMDTLLAGTHAFCLKDITTKSLSKVIHSFNDVNPELDPVISELALTMFNDDASNITSITPHYKTAITLENREQEVLRLLTMGKKNSEIADTLFVSVHTIKSHVSTILQKLAVDNRVQAAVKALSSGLVTV
jgi:two-component system, NarL family, response regulator LiaR